MNEATNGSLGWATRSPGVPVWRSSPSTITPTSVGQRRCVLEVVGDEQDGDVEAGEQMLQLRADVGLRVGVECGERLVEEQDLRVAGQGAREGHALALAAGEVAGVGALEMPNRETVEVLVGLVTPAVLDVLTHGQVREERVVLEDEPDRRRSGGQRDAGGAVEPHRARRS